MWRAPDEQRVLLDGGPNHSVRRGAPRRVVFGIVGEHPMRSWRGRQRRLVRPGQLVAWDPSHAHAGSAVDERPWGLACSSRSRGSRSARGRFRVRPVGRRAVSRSSALRHRARRSFLRLHATLESACTRLEQDELPRRVAAAADRPHIGRPLAAVRPRPPLVRTARFASPSTISPTSPSGTSDSMSSPPSRA